MRLWGLTIVAGLGLQLSMAVAAADGSADQRIRALEAQLEQQQRALEQQQQFILRQQEVMEAMQRELQQLKADQAGTAPMAAATAADKPPATALADEDGGNQVTFYGHVQLDAIHDFKRVDPTWESTLRPSTIPTVDGTFGSDGLTIISVKQTQFGFKGQTATPMGQVNSWFEFDFFGTGTDAGDTKFNLRHAWVEVGGLGFGQTNSNFMDISIFPNVVDWWGPSGMVFNRNAQLRYTWAGDDSEWAVALEKPNGSFNTGIFGDLSPEFDALARAKTEWPDLTLHWRNEFDWGHYQLAGVLRKLEFETRGTPRNKPRGDEPGWGINLTSVVNLLDRDQLKLGLVYGEGIASFMNDGGVNLAPGNDQGEAVPVLGVTAYYDRYWSDRWSSSLGFSVNDADPRNQQADREFDRGIYASANLLYTPYPEFLIGTEFLYGEHKDVGGRRGEDYRLQFTFKHKFGRTF